MPEPRTEIKPTTCIVRLDRIQFLGEAPGDRLPQIPGFRVKKDSFVRPQTTPQTYRRVRYYKNSKTKAALFIQFWPSPSWLAPIKGTTIGADFTGLSRSELEDIFKVFTSARLLTVELAFDFSKASGVDRAFVLRHGVFGKSRLRGGRLYNDLRFGTRHSETLVRAYAKREISSYRVELELHSSWLRRNRLTSLEDLSKLSGLLSPGRIQFVEFDWDSLTNYLSRKGLPAEKLICQSQSFAHSIHRVLDYLRNELGLHNLHRLLRPLAINRQVESALEEWGRQWS